MNRPDSTVDLFLLVYKFGLIIYINTARIVIDHISSF